MTFDQPGKVVGVVVSQVLGRLREAVQYVCEAIVCGPSRVGGDLAEFESVAAFGRFGRHDGHCGSFQRGWDQPLTITNASAANITTATESRMRIAARSLRAMTRWYSIWPSYPEGQLGATPEVA